MRNPLHPLSELVLCGTISCALDDHTLVFRGDDGKLHTVGKEYQAEYAADEVLCFRGLPVATNVRTMDMANRTLAGLIDHPHTLYFGTLRTLHPVHLPPVTGFAPVSGSAHTLSLKYATGADIVALELDSLPIEQGILIARTQIPHADVNPKPGTRIPAIHSTFTVRADQSCAYLVWVNDTVTIGQEIARITYSSISEEERSILRQRLALVEREREKKLQDLAARVQRKAQLVVKDSIAFYKHLLLQSQGFVAQRRVDSASHRFNRSVSELRTLIASEPYLRESYALRLRKLKADLAQLEAKDPGRHPDAVIRSDAHGIVTDIRRRTVGTRSQITIIINPL